MSERSERGPSVALEALAERIIEYGPVAFLTTVGEEGPHVVSVQVSWRGEALAVGAGTTTGRNAAARPAVTLLWPSPPGSPYCLIVDGAASAAEDGSSLVITPGRAVLHRLADAPVTAGPNCVTVLPRTD